MEAHMSPRVTPENRIPDIIRAAAAVFSRKGYRLTQMDEIAGEANISKATLYYYFKNKIHLFHYVLENGVPAKGEAVVPPGDFPPKTEDELLQLLKKRLKTGSGLTSIRRFLSRKTGDVDFAGELAEILEEMWDVIERNRVQIVILEKSAFEFPELAEAYDKFARREMLGQVERYLKSRIRIGAAKKLGSVEAVARFIVESFAWFGFKQRGGRMALPYASERHYDKEKTLPDLVTVLLGGLENQLDAK